jgi:hypothetical protein
MSTGASSKSIVEDVDDVVFIPKSKRSDLGIGVKRVFRPVDVTAPVSPSPPPDPLLATNSISSRTVTAPAPQQSSVKPQTNNLVATATSEPSAGKGVVAVVSQSQGQQNQRQNQQNPDRDLMDELKMKHRSRHEYYLESKETLTNALAEVHTGRDGAMRLANMNPQGRGRGRGGRGRGQSGPHRRY